MKAEILFAVKYDSLVMKLDEICIQIGMEIGTARNRLSAGTFPLPTRKQGKYIIADVRDVGRYLDTERALALECYEIATAAR